MSSLVRFVKIFSLFLINLFVFLLFTVKRVIYVFLITVLYFIKLLQMLSPS